MLPTRPTCWSRSCSNVVGFDLNPLAVISARTNYLLALGDLLQHRSGEISIPVYLADSILTPQSPRRPPASWSWVRPPSRALLQHGRRPLHGAAIAGRRSVHRSTGRPAGGVRRRPLLGAQFRAPAGRVSADAAERRRRDRGCLCACSSSCSTWRARASTASGPASSRTPSPRFLGPV